MSDANSSDIIVIGAGLAGGFTAHAFAKRGARVRILESSHDLATKASGNRFALLTPYITTKASSLATLYSAGYAFSSSLFSSLDELTEVFRRCGALQLPASDRLAAALADRDPLIGLPNTKRVSSQEASTLCGLELSFPAFHVSDAGFIEPRVTLARLLDKHRASLSVQYRARAVSLLRTGNSWGITCDDGSVYYASKIIICGAYEATSLAPCEWLPLEAIRGQTVSVAPSCLTKNLRTVITFGGYITPAVSGYHFLGAHYRHNDSRTTPLDSDTSDIYVRYSKWLPAAQLNTTEVVGARVCFRTSTVDRLPYIGALPDFAGMGLAASNFRSGTEIRNKVPISHLQGVFINLGHGSRGLLSCPIGGELVARIASGQALAELTDAAETVSPDRLPYSLLRRKLPNNE